MTGSYPNPTWGDIDSFCKIDGWTQVETTDHVHWEKTLPSGEVLATHRSLAANKTIGPGVFGVILRSQLKVSRHEFWRAISGGKAVDRPTELDEPPAEYPAWIVFGLRKYGLSEAQVRTMTPEEAEALLRKKWSELNG